MGMIVCLVVIPMTVLAQPSRIIGTIRAEHANAIVRAINPMAGYVMAGWTMRPIAGSSNMTKDALVVRVNPDGSLISNINNAVIFGGLQDEEATSMIRTSDQSYVVAGWTRSYNNPPNTNADIFVIKFKPDLIHYHWAKVYHMLTNDLGHRANSIIEVTASPVDPGGYILTGYLLSPNTATRRILVLRLDLSGNVTWVRTYGMVGTVNNLYNEGFSITEVSDITVPNVKFAVVGRTASTLNARGDAFMMRLGSNGSLVLPTLVFSGNYDTHARSVAWDGQFSGLVAPGIMVAGMVKSTNTPSPIPANILVARIRTNAMIVDWSYEYKWDTANGPDRADYIQGDKALIVIPGNAVTPSNFVLCGITYSRGPNIPNAPNIMLMRLKHEGIVDWNENATVFPMILQPNTNNFDVANGVVQSPAIPGNGFAVAGWTNSIFNPNLPPNLAGHNILFTTFTPGGMQSGSCDAQFKIKNSTLSHWAPKTFDQPTNHMRPKDIQVSDYTVTSVLVCQ